MNELRTARLLLRPPTGPEAEALVRGEVPGTLPCVEGYPHADTPDAFRTFAEGWREESPPDPGWLVIRASDGLAIGEIGFGFEVEPGVRTGGYGFATSAWGEGYASEALAVVLPHVLSEPGVWRVVADALKSNVASWRVMEKAGMRFVRQVEREEGGVLTTLVEYAISAEQSGFPPRRPRSPQDGAQSSG